MFAPVRVASASRFALLIGILAATCVTEAEAQQRMVYNSVTGRTEAQQLPWRSPQAHRTSRTAGRALPSREASERSQTRRQAEVAPSQQRTERPIRQARQQTTQRRQPVVPADYQQTSEFEQDFALSQCGLGCGGCEPTCGCDPGCGCDIDCCDTGCCETVGCGDVCGAAAGGCYAGIELTYLKPYHEHNTAYNEQDSLGTDSEFFSENYQYDNELSPRVFVGWENCCGTGLAVTWWHFDHDASPLDVTPITSSVVATPIFGESNAISSTTANAGRGLAIDGDPTQTMAMRTGLEAYTIDLEGTKTNSFCCWDLGVSCGLRYARIEQSTFANVNDVPDGQIGQLSYNQSFEGFGPTLSLYAFRPLSCTCGVFGKARGSVLCGDGRSNLTTAITTPGTAPTTAVFTADTGRDDVMPILEMQIGWRWQGAASPGKSCVPFLTTAFEGQFWHGAGNANSEEGSLGFFGLTSAAGVKW